MRGGDRYGPDPPGVVWVAVEELPPTAAERRHDARLYTLLDLVFYAIIVILTLYITYPSGILDDPLYLGLYLAMLGGFAVLFYVRHRARSRTFGRNPFYDRSRVGSSGSSFYLEDFTGRREVPWASMSTPRLGEWRGRTFYVLPYRTASGEVVELRLTAARMAATLGLRDRPLWDLPAPLLAKLEDDYRSRGLAPPETSVPSSDRA